MRRSSVTILLLAALLLVWPQTVLAGGGSDSSIPDSLCLPANYLNEEPDCTLLGPAEQLTQNAWIANQIQSQSRRFIPIVEDWGQTDLRYVRLNPDNPRWAYPNLDAAVERNGGQSHSLPGGFSYASYTSRALVDGKAYYQLPTGYWIRSGATTSGIAKPNQFRGVLPQEGTPTRKFGWMLNEVETSTVPGFKTKYGSGRTISRHTLVEVFDTSVYYGWDWYMIAPGEWVVQSDVALVYPAAEPPKGVISGRWIEINLFEQTIAVYDNNEMVYATLTTSGSKEFYTRPGLFQIYEKVRNTNMAGGGRDEDDRYYLMNVPWSMFFDERRAFHGEYWHDHLGYKSSHGCANLSFPDAEWLYLWAQFGDWVYVWDPSGQTPEDPSLFTELITLKGAQETALK